MCQDVCHVIRDHEENKARYAGPRFFIRFAELEMHPLDTNDRRELVRQQGGLGMCNITKCCTEVCPEHIKITDNAIIPMKERVVDASLRPGGDGWAARSCGGPSGQPEEAAAGGRSAPVLLSRMGGRLQRRRRRARRRCCGHRTSLAASGGSFRVAQVVHGAPDGDLTVALVVTDGRLSLEREDPATAVPGPCAASCWGGARGAAGRHHHPLLHGRGGPVPGRARSGRGASAEGASGCGVTWPCWWPARPSWPPPPRTWPTSRPPRPTEPSRLALPGPPPPHLSSGWVTSAAS